MNNQVASKFVARLVGGCIVAIILGRVLDAYAHSSPWIMMGLLLYVVVGSLYMLVKESKDERHG